MTLSNIAFSKYGVINAVLCIHEWKKDTWSGSIFNSQHKTIKIDYDFSLLGHKEFRFLLPILPLAMHVCGCYLHHITDNSDDDDDDGQSPQLEPTLRRRHYSSAVCSWKVFLVISLVLTNLPLAMYTSLLHQRGTVDVTRFLHDQSMMETKDMRMRVLFLMPCHSTPYYRWGYLFV